jgi:hypothetical protein
MGIILSNPNCTPPQGPPRNITVHIDAETTSSTGLLRLRYSSAGTDMLIDGGTSVDGGTHAISTTPTTITNQLAISGSTGLHKLRIIGQQVRTNGDKVGNPRERSCRVRIN